MAGCQRNHQRKRRHSGLRSYKIKINLNVFIKEIQWTDDLQLFTIFKKKIGEVILEDLVRSFEQNEVIK